MLKNPPMDDKNRNNVQMNPPVDDTKRKIVQKNSIVVVAKKRGQKVDYKLANTPLRR
jgi:hypothetical protein